MKQRSFWSAAALCALSIAGPVSAASACPYYDPQANYQGYIAWCKCIGGTPRNVGRTDIGCTPPAGGGSAYSGGGVSPNFQQTVASQMAAFGGQLLGNLLRDAIFGNPQEEARRQAEYQAWQLEAQRQQALIAAEQAHIREERHKKLMAALKEVGGGPELTPKGISSQPLELKTGTDFFVRPGNPAKEQVAQELQLKGIGDPEIALSTDPSAQLNAAAYLAGKATLAKSPQDSTVLLEAAYEAATGKKIDFQVPPDVVGKPVSQERLTAFSGIQKSYLAAQEETQKAQQRLAGAKYKKEVADKVHQDAEKKMKEIENQPRPQNPEEQKALDDKKAEAEKLLREAIHLDDQMTQDLEKAKREADQARIKLNDADQRTRDYVKGLGGSSHPQ